MKKLTLFLVFYIFLVLIWFAIHSFQITQISPITLNTPTPNFSFAKVERVIDGDTFELDGGERVRLIGVDAPEYDGCFSREARDNLDQLVGGRKVELVKDVSEADKYGRLLRFVYIGDIFVNDELVKDGFAKVETVPPDVGFEKEFEASENYAKGNKLGLWKKCF